MTVNDTSKVGLETEAEDEAGAPAGTNSDEVPPGSVLSDTYEIVEQVAQGGMAQVYRARNIHTDEPVAIKLVLPEFARDKTIIALFKKEATVLSRLHHDAIVNYHMFTIEPRMKRPYLVMEFVDGVHLGDFFRGAPLSAESCRTLMIRVASGLAAAHDAGVIHRDLSPDNVILPESDVAKTKIIDFGIAKAATVGEGTLLGGKFAGKYNFVSPEQLGLAGGEITERSDIYSLGLIAAAAMLGRPLDMSGSHVQVLDKRREIPDLAGVDPSIRPAIEAMLAPLPENRPHDMRAVIDLWANTTIMADDGKTVIAVDPWTTTPPQRSMPPQRSTPPQRSMPPQTSMPPDPSMPPQRSMPPAASWDAPSTPTTPPDFGSTVVADRPDMPGRMPPTSAPPQSMPSARSMPPISQPPPQSPPPSARTVVGEAAPGSESPFGPYVDKGPKFQLPPKVEKPAKKGAPIGLIVGAAAVVVVAGGLGLGFTQGWFGSSPAPQQPTAPAEGATTPAPQPTPQPVETANTPGTNDTPVVSEPAPVTGDGKGTQVATSGGDTAPQSGVVDTPQPTTGGNTVVDSPAPPVVNEPVPTEAAPKTDETKVANVPDTAVPGLTKAAQQLAWLNAYPLGKCEYAHATQVADNSFGIEAYGASLSPFQTMASDFRKANGVDPQVAVRILDQSQCPVAEFLESVDALPIAQPGANDVPQLKLTDTNIESGGTLAGTISATPDWHTELLLVDYAGGVQNITPVLQPSGPNLQFALQGLATNTSDAAPLVLIAVAGKTGAVDAAQFSQTFVVGAVLPRILHEIEQNPSNYTVSPVYFQIQPPK